MARTRVKSDQIGDGQVKRSDLNATETGEAVIRKVIAGDGVDISSTGADAGTGDVTINVPGTIPSGGVIMWPGSAVPDGWLLCDASEVSRSTYAGIFAVTGTGHGAGNGSSTFNLPGDLFVATTGTPAPGMLTIIKI